MMILSPSSSIIIYRRYNKNEKNDFIKEISHSLDLDNFLNAPVTSDG